VFLPRQFRAAGATCDPLADAGGAHGKTPARAKAADPDKARRTGRKKISNRPQTFCAGDVARRRAARATEKCLSIS
jgi:hypothetical protein